MLHLLKEEQKGEFLISTDKEKLDQAAIHQYISTESYWAKDIPLTTLKKSIENSFCFGVYHMKRQIGFARVISDYSTFAYLADVYILSEYRKKGLSKWLMQFIMEHEELQGLRRFSLATKDAHGLYTQFGFKQIESPDRFMEIKNANVYTDKKI
jgi:GNAT superfamily N-acetyltransferase